MRERAVDGLAQEVRCLDLGVDSSLGVAVLRGGLPKVCGNIQAKVLVVWTIWQTWIGERVDLRASNKSDEGLVND